MSRGDVPEGGAASAVMRAQCRTVVVKTAESRVETQLTIIFAVESFFYLHHPFNIKYLKGY